MKYRYIAVNNICVEQYEGAVFNLRVPADECFIAEGIVVHNCPHHVRPAPKRKLTTAECGELWVGQ
jgi:hypothetical protein